MERRLVTAALAYINNIPHLGHIAGSHLPADVFARYCRTKGYETLFVGGTDESGSTTEISALEAGVDIDTFSSVLYREHSAIYDWFRISYDTFSRTSVPLHHEMTQEFFRAVQANGFVSEDTMKVFYSPEDDRFLPDRYIEGTCPRCGNEKANGDQCEVCSLVLDPTQLVNPRSTVSGAAVEIRESKHLFLRLDSLSADLERWIEGRTSWRRQVSSAALGWIKEGLNKRSITRDLHHGVEVPLPGYEKKVFYVWFDAPIGYITFTREAAPDRWELFWRNPESRIYHFLGKDNIPFHTIFWPGMLMANGSFNLPHHVEGLQYLNYEGGKFSKSQRRGVFCEALPATGIDPDLMRAYLVMVLPEVGDTEFAWKDFQVKMNSELIGNFGNLVNRSLTFVNNKLGGVVARPADGELTDRDRRFLAAVEEAVKAVGERMEAVQLKGAFLQILALSAEGNRYFSENRPWDLVGSDDARARRVLYLCVHLCRALAILMSPYLPGTAGRIWQQLALPGSPHEPGSWDEAAEVALGESHTVGTAEILFPKLKDEDIERLKAAAAKPRGLKEILAT